MNRLTVLCLFVTTSALAQDGIYSLGARHAGLSGTTVTYADSWATFNNVGGLGAVDRTSAFVSYQNRYGINSFQVFGGGFNYHADVGNVGLKYYKFGDDLFSQQLAGLAVGNRFQMVSLGIGLNVIQTAAEGQQTDQVLAIEFGGRAQVTPQLFFGAHIFNLRNTHEHPTSLKAGISYRPINEVRLNMEVEKQLSAYEMVKAGLEYQPISKLFIRTGLNLQRSMLNKSHVSPAFGLGFQPGTLLIDYAFVSKNDLGAIHEISLRHHFGKP